MSSPVLRVVTMLALLIGGSAWVWPHDTTRLDPGIRFEEVAERSGCLNRHTMVELSPEFSNIMPWLSSVGAAVAAADFDGDGRTDLYVTNSGRGSANRLFRARGDGTFEDVAERAGVACGNPEGASMHAIFGDVNNDGRPDLYLTKWAARNQLFLNRGDGTFEDVTERAGVGYWGYGNAATFVDFDRDGHLDILLGNYFADSLPDPRTGKMARSDLWNPVTTRVMHSTFTHADNGGKTVLYRNRGDGKFEDVAERMGLHFRGWTLSVGAADLNDDGWPDLYLANDFGPDELYMNRGAAGGMGFARVVDTSGHPGIGNDWWKGMNIDFGDVDGNGALDLYVTNIRARRYKSDEGNMLWLNFEGPGQKALGAEFFRQIATHRRFRDVGAAAGVDDGGWGWGGKFLDANNDGRLDIFTVNGFVTGDASHTYWYALQEMVTQTKNNAADAADWPVMGSRDLSGREQSRLFVQVPPESKGAKAGAPATPRFAEVSEAAGITDVWNGRGIAVLDLDDDGALDLYVANQGQPSVLYRNRGGATKRHWLGLSLEGRPDLVDRTHSPLSNRDAVGARLELEAGGRLQVREVSGGTGYSSQSERRIHFGLGDVARPDRLVVRWPSGREQTFQGEALAACVDGYAHLVEGGALEPGEGGASARQVAAARPSHGVVLSTQMAPPRAGRAVPARAGR